MLVLQAGSKLSRDDVRHYVRESVDVFVQLERRGGRRRISRVLVAEWRAVALAVQQSLFEAGGVTPMVESGR